MSTTTLRSLSGLAIIALLSLGLVACSSGPDHIDDEEAPPPMEPTEEEPAEPAPEPAPEPGPEPAPGDEPAPTEPAPMPESQIDVTDEHIGQLADVLIATEELEEGIEEELAAAETHADIQAIEERIMGELQVEVEAAGLTMEEYEAIIAELQVNPELFQDLEAELEERGRADLLQQPAM